jgi:hypothetical protein
MATAKFGIDATGTYVAQNAVTPQTGVIDRSGEMLIGAAGSAIEGGLQLYKAKKVGDITQAAETEVATEVGMLADIFKEGEKPPSLEQYKESLARANQAMEIGGLNAQDRATLRVKSLIRKKSAENPWFANTYAQIGNQVLSNYSDQLALFSKMEEALQTSAGASADIDKAVRKQAETLQGQSRLNPGFVIGTAPIEAVQNYILEAQRISEAEKRAEELRVAADQARQERTARATERTAIATERSTALVEEKKNGELRDSDYSRSIRTSISGRVNNAIKQFNTNLKSGQLVQGEEEIKKDAATKIMELRSGVNEVISTYPWTDTVERDKLIADMERQIAGIEQIFTGPLSDIKIKAEQLERMTLNTRLDAAQNAPLLFQAFSFGGAQGATAVIQNAINEDTGVQLRMRQEYAGLTGSQLDSKQVELLMGSIERGNLDGVPIDLRPSVQASAVRNLEGNADPKNPIKIESPAQWGKLFLVAAGEDGLNASDADVLTKTVFNSTFVSKFNELLPADKGVAEEVMMSMVTALPSIGSSLVSAAQAVPAEAGTLQIDKESGEFFVEGSTGDPKRLNRAATRLNNLMNSMAAVSVLDRRVPKGVNPKLWYAQNVLGIKGLLEEPAQ